jgi:hypothetical protein
VDQYGRLLRYVVRAKDRLNVNVQLVRLGAAARTSTPDGEAGTPQCWNGSPFERERGSSACGDVARTRRTTRPEASARGGSPAADERTDGRTPERRQVRLIAPSGPRPEAMTAQGHSKSIFKKAIENGNLLVAEMTVREFGRITLHEALLLTALVADQDPERRSRYAVRWLRRLLEESDSLTIEEAAMAASCLSALGGQSHDEALGMLSAMADRATS